MAFTLNPVIFRFWFGTHRERQSGWRGTQRQSRQSCWVRECAGIGDAELSSSSNVTPYNCKTPRVKVYLSQVACRKYSARSSIFKRVENPNVTLFY